MDIQTLIDREIESIKRSRMAVVGFQPPQFLSGEFEHALACAKQAKGAEGKSAQTLLAEAQFLHAYTKKVILAWAKGLDTIRAAVTS